MAAGLFGQLKDYYDWLVIGDHPGALLSATLMAKRGFSVVVLLDDMDRPGSHIIKSRSGEVIDPEPNAVMGLVTGSLLRECTDFLEAELPVIEGGDKGNDNGLQLITPHFRLNLADESKNLDRALLQELGNSHLQFEPALQTVHGPLHQFWRSFTDYSVPNRGGKSTRRPPTGRTVALARDAAARGRGAWKPIQKALSEMSEPVARELRLAIHAAAMTTVREQDHEFLADLWMVRTSAAVKGGLSEYRAELIRVGKKLGIHFAARSQCKRLFMEKRRLIGLQWADPGHNRGKMIGLGGGAIGTSIENVEPMFDSQKRRLRMPLKPLGWRMTVGVRVPAEGLPPGLLRRNIFKETGAPWIEMEVTNPSESPTGFKRTSSSERILYMRTALPWTEESLRPEVQRRIATRMFAQVRQMLPFLEYHVVNSFPDLSFSDAGLTTYREAYGFKSLEAIPDALRIQDEKGMGVFTGIDGLYLVNGEAFPEFGTWAGNFGGTVAALESLAWFSDERRRVGDMRFGRDGGRFFGFLENTPRK